MMPTRTSLDSRNSSSTTCGDINVAKLSLLGQQFAHCTAHQSPSSTYSSRMGTQLLTRPSSSHAVSHLHTHFQQQVSSHLPSQTGENGVATTSSYQNSHQAFSFGLDQGYNSVYRAQGIHNGSLGELAKVIFPEGPASSLASPQVILSSLSLLQHKIQQLQVIVQSMAQGNVQSVAQQQEVATGVASVVSQLIMATVGMLQQSDELTNHMMAADMQLNKVYGGMSGPAFNMVQQNGAGNYFGTPVGSSMGNSLGNFIPVGGESTPLGVNLSIGGGGVLSGLVCPATGGQNVCGQGLGSSSGSSRDPFHPSLVQTLNNSLDIGVGTNGNFGGCQAGNPSIVHNEDRVHGSFEEQDNGIGLKEDDDDGEGENLPPGSYELVEMDAIEILAEHTHFCEICGKGFKRDANLRMHMRGHGDEYKTPAALARPDKSSHAVSLIRLRRYSCPFVGCKRNKNHRKFQPLKTMLCVKNHYRRSHCPKMLTCSKCKSKKFSVVADLKTHEKHCGRDKWQCSCGTTFSRKDKLFGHVGLFAGHMPAFPVHEMEGSGGGESGTNGPLSFTSANSSATGHGGKEPAFLAGPGSNNFVHGNKPLTAPALVAGSCSAIEVGNGARMGVEVDGNGKHGRLQTLGSRSDSLSDDCNGTPLGGGSSLSTGIAGSMVPSSSIFQGLFPSSFLQQANENSQDSSHVLS